MTPEQTAILQTVALILEKLSSTPGLLALVLLFLAPLAAVVWVVWRLPKMITKITSTQDARMQVVFDRQDQRHAEFVKMYEDNVDLVRTSQQLTSAFQDITKDLKQLVLLTGQTMQQLVDSSDNNAKALFRMIEKNENCPLIRPNSRMRITIEEDRKG